MFEQTQKIIKLNQEFEAAIAEGNIDKVKELFSEDKEETDKPYIDFEMVTSTAIMIAAQKQDWEMVKTLFNLNADLDVKIMPHKWYLINECIVNAPDKITTFIINESNVNVQNAYGATPLMIAIERNKGIMAEYLIETGRVDLVLTNKLGENAAHYAAKAENYDLFLKLIEKGVPLLAKNKDGKTPIDLITNETFKLSLPLELNKIAETGNDIVLVGDQKETSIEAKNEEPVKKVTGLSSIKKRQ